MLVRKDLLIHPVYEVYPVPSSYRWDGDKYDPSGHEGLVQLK